MLYNMYVHKIASAELESMITAARVSTKQREAMVVSGKDPHPHLLLGLDYSSSKVGFYEVNHEEMMIVKEIYEKFSIYKSYSEVIAYCAERGYKTKSYKTQGSVDEMGVKIPPRVVEAKPFNQKSLRSLLQSGKYRGYGVFEDTYDQFPKLQDEEKIVRWSYAHGPLLDQSLIEKVDQALPIAGFTKIRSSSESRSSSLLAGLVFDKEANPYHCNSAKNGKNLYYYNPKTKHRISMTEMDDTFLNLLKSYQVSDNIIEKVIEDFSCNMDMEVADIASELQKLEAELFEKLNDLSSFQDKLTNALKADLSDFKIKAIKDQVDRLETSITEFKQKRNRVRLQMDNIRYSYSIDHIRNWFKRSVKSILEAKTRSEQKGLVKQFICKIIVNADETANVVFDLSKVPLPPGPKPGGDKVAEREEWWRSAYCG